MKQLISATLSQEAAAIYNNWEKQKKSAILSELIIQEESHRLQIHALQSMRGKAHGLISQAMIHIKLKDGLTPLVKRMNDMLIGTIYYQYWE
tara:strand:- start:3 stop:278 length:276 start_codon:yes stop_codon:yes gene_type:complete